MIGQRGWLGRTWAQPQNQGFIWGIGTAAGAYFLWPVVQSVLRPRASHFSGDVMAAGDGYRRAMAGATGGLEDAMGMGPDPGMAPADGHTKT